jgi:hypothetical protein
LSTPTAGP